MHSAAIRETNRATDAAAAVEGGRAVATPRQRVKKRLHIYFAAATCLSGLTLAGNPATETFAIIACFFAIFGLVFVDLLRWFALPSVAAYLSLGLIALFSIGRFWDRGMGGTDDHQMVIVAELLVLVQAVLMLQQKNRRIYEQLTIFCLLELIVAAIFNDAVSFGLLLVPLGVVGAAALALLQTYQTTESFSAVSDASANKLPQGAIVRVSSSRSADSFHHAGLYLPWLSLTVLAPAVLLLAILFFYGLPRTSMAEKRMTAGPVLVGFTESVQLGQIGRMLQSDALALRIELSDRDTNKPYAAAGGVYLRGAVLEKYHTEPHEGTWSAGAVPPWSRRGPLPPIPASQPPIADQLGEPDDIRVRITLEATNSAALFSVPPYHSLATAPSVVHQDDRWLLSRRRSQSMTNTGRTSYQYATTAFSGGKQTRFVPRFVTPRPGGALTLADGDERQSALTSGAAPSHLSPPRSRPPHVDADSYARSCLEYDEYRVPSAWRLSETVLSAVAERDENALEIAFALERYFAYHGGYRYTLNLTGETIPGLDPVEQFLAVDRQGNCQHFASALALMLRSQGIPSRLVVGYKTDEYNTIGGFYAARQLHAHAWVEALIDAKWVPGADLPDAAPISDQYWVRLDPTPGGGGVDRAVGGRVSELFELAQNMWSDYVIHRAGPRPRREGLGGGGDEMVTSQYQALFQWVGQKLSWLSGRELRGAAPKIGTGFSWTAALLSIAFALAVLPLYHFGWRPAMTRWRRPAHPSGRDAQRPRIAFYAETLALLERIGFRRASGQTPLELTNQAAAALRLQDAPPLDGPLRLLTDAFYHTRFSGAAGPDASSGEPTDPEVMAALQSVRARVEMIESQPRA